MELDYIKHIDAMKLLKSLPDSSIDLIVTDPPYDIDRGGEKKGEMGERRLKQLNSLVQDNIANGYDIRAYGKEFLRVLKKPNIYLWCNKRQIPEYLQFYAVENGLKFDILFYAKTNVMPSFNMTYLVDTEYCLYFHKGAYLRPQNKEDATTWHVQPTNTQDKKVLYHPTIKPLNIIKKLVRNSSREGDVVLDCFMGSGTTAVACKEQNRHYIGSEIIEKYYKIATARLENKLIPDYELGINNSVENDNRNSIMDLL